MRTGDVFLYRFDHLSHGGDDDSDGYDHAGCYNSYTTAYNSYTIANMHIRPNRTMPGRCY